MRPAVLAAAATVLVVSCSPGSGPVARQATPSRTASPATKSPTLARCAAPESSYGLLISGGKLEMIGRSGCLGPSAAIAPSLVQNCSDGLPAVLAPPVSSSGDKVYFRDGDTRIRSMTPAGEMADVTTVPGGAATVSFFSVSPDDQRIAVLVEDLSASGTIGLRLYVEDLSGAGHHADIYTTTIPRGQGGLSLWPMGWHSGRLVLALVLACSASPIRHPVAWHVVDAANANRLASIDVGTCLSSLLPSAGVVCFDPTPLVIKIYDWSGKLTYEAGGTFLSLDLPVGLSPSGQSLFLNQGSACQGGVGDCPRMWAHGLEGGGGMQLVEGHYACLWIDDSSILSNDAVVAYPSGSVSTLPLGGQCVGRFPGGL